MNFMKKAKDELNKTGSSNKIDTNNQNPPWDVKHTDKIYTKEKKPKPVKEKDKFLTVYTDGSFCPETKACGWGVWMRDEHGSKENSGGLNHIANSAEAEYLAAFQGLKLAKDYVSVAKTDRVIVLVTDFQELQIMFNNVIRQGSLGKYEYNHRLSGHAKKVLEISQAIGNSIIRVKKVKAHNSSDGARSWANNKVDKLAYSQMDKRRTQNKKGL